MIFIKWPTKQQSIHISLSCNFIFIVSGKIKDCHMHNKFLMWKSNHQKNIKLTVKKNSRYEFRLWKLFTKSIEIYNGLFAERKGRNSIAMENTNKKRYLGYHVYPLKHRVNINMYRLLIQNVSTIIIIFQQQRSIYWNFSLNIYAIIICTWMENVE